MDNVAQPSIVLRPLKFTDFPQVLLWNQDIQFCEANGWSLNQDEERLFRWRGMFVNNTSNDFFRIGIEWDQKLIGYVDFAEVNNGGAEIGIAIGDSTLWQRGLGKEALSQALEFGSKNYAIHSYRAETELSNVRAQNLLIRAGFKKIKQTDSTIFYKVTL